MSRVRKSMGLVLLIGASALVTALVSGVASAAAPADDAGSGPGGLEQFDRKLQELHNLIWGSAEHSASIGADAAGHTLSADIDALVLTPDTVARLQQLRKQAASPGLGDGAASGLTALYEASAVLERERRMLLQLDAYWNVVPAERYLRGLWQKQLTLVAPERAAASTQRITALEQTTWAARTQDSGASSGPSPALRGVGELLAAYNQERQELASLVAAGSSRKSEDVATVARTTPCPAPAPDAAVRAGDQPLQVVRTGDPAEFYPKSEENLYVEGRVVLTLKIAATGCVVSSGVRASSGDALLDDAGMKFVETIQYLPALKAGVPVEVYKDLAVKFAFTQHP